MSATKKATADAKTATLEVVSDANERVTAATKSMTNILSSFSTSGQKALSGIVEVDKALFGYARKAMKDYVELGRNSVGARTVNDLVDLQVAFAHNFIEQNVANTREVLELAQSKAKEAYEPIKTALTKEEEAAAKSA